MDWGLNAIHVTSMQWNEEDIITMQVLMWLQSQGLKTIQSLPRLGDTEGAVREQLASFDKFNSTCTVSFEGNPQNARLSRACSYAYVHVLCWCMCACIMCWEVYWCLCWVCVLLSVLVCVWCVCVWCVCVCVCVRTLCTYIVLSIHLYRSRCIYVS